MPVDSLHGTSVSACNPQPSLPKNPKFKKTTHAWCVHISLCRLLWRVFTPLTQWQRLQRSSLWAAENHVSLGCLTAFELSFSKSLSQTLPFPLCAWQERPGLPGGLQAGRGLRLLRRMLGLARVRERGSFWIISIEGFINVTPAVMCFCH